MITKPVFDQSFHQRSVITLSNKRPVAIEVFADINRDIIREINASHKHFVSLKGRNLDIFLHPLNKRLSLMSFF